MTTRGGARIRVFHRLFLVVIALFALAAGLSQTVVASAAPRRSATVEPATKLTDQVVKVNIETRITGFLPCKCEEVSIRRP